MWSKIKIASAQNKNVHHHRTCGRSCGGEASSSSSNNECYERAREKEVQRVRWIQKKSVSNLHIEPVCCVWMWRVGYREHQFTHAYTIIRPIQMSANPICNDPGTRKILAIFVFQNGKKKKTESQSMWKLYIALIYVMCECRLFLFSSSSFSCLIVSLSLLLVGLPINRLCPKKELFE